MKGMRLMHQGLEEGRIMHTRCRTGEVSSVMPSKSAGSLETNLTCSHVVQCSAVQCSAMQCSAVWCSPLQCSAVWCGEVLRSVVLSALLSNSAPRA